MRYLIYLLTALLTFIISVVAVRTVRQDYVTRDQPLRAEVTTHVCGGLRIFRNVVADESGLYTNDLDALQKVSEEINQSQDILARFENLEGTPLTIREVRMKPITRRQYHRITGWPEERSSDLAYLHTVTLTNNTDRPINCFALALTGKPVTRADGLRAWIAPMVTIEPMAPIETCDALLMAPIEPHSSFIYRR